MWVIANDELYHHGIKGQKWGIRRYQNPDGTLTEEGKERYNRAIYKAFRKNLKRSKFGTWKTEESRYTKQISKDIDEIVKNKSNLLEIGKKYNDLSRKLNAELEKFWDSKDCEKIRKKVEDQFEEEYGRKPRKVGKHNYNKNDLKLMNFYDEDFIEAESKWRRNNQKYQKLKKECEKAYDDYYEECERITDFLVSEKYRNVKLKDASGSTIPFNREVFKRVRRSGKIKLH